VLAMMGELKDLNIVKVKKVISEKGYYEIKFFDDEKARILAIKFENDIPEDAYLFNVLLEILNSDGTGKEYSVHGLNTLVGCLAGGKFFSEKDDAINYYDSQTKLN